MLNAVFVLIGVLVGCHLAHSQENVALKKTTRDSVSSVSGKVGDGALGVDGDVATCVRLIRSPYTGQVWYEIDLGQVSKVKHLLIHHTDPQCGKVLNCQRKLNNFKVYVRQDRLPADADYTFNSLDLCHASSVDLSGEKAVDVWCKTTLTGRYVVISRDDTLAMTVCEVKVLVCPNSKYGAKCDKACECKDAKDVCNPYNGACASGCAVDAKTLDCRTRDSNDCLKASQYYAKEQCQDCNCAAETTCDRYGACSGACAPGWTKSADQCDEKCTAGTFGTGCVKTCHCVRDEACNHVTGVCASGCAGNYSGVDCQNVKTDKCNCDGSCDVNTDVCDSNKCLPGWKLEAGKCINECDNGNFGQNCASVCHCKNGQPCDKVTGSCASVGGCGTGYDGGDCQSCLGGYFGKSCVRCNCASGVACDKVKGCDGKCHHRYYDTDCLSTCPASKYVVNGACSGDCHCLDNRDCKVLDGVCESNQCAVNFVPPVCQVCREGYYGLLCLAACHCGDNVKCDRQKGCGGVCSHRYTGGECQTTCHDGSYLVNSVCNGTCRCRDKMSCRVTDGTCLKDSCVGNYAPPTCQKCKAGFYGKECSLSCHCKDGASCDAESGTCPGECHHRYTGASCVNTCKDGQYNPPACDKQCPCLNSDQCHVTSGACLDNKCKAGACDQNCPRGKWGKECTDSCHCMNNGVCDSNTGVCLHGAACDPRYTGHNCQKTCVSGRFGAHTGCEGVCHCRHPQNCNVINGYCTDRLCADGFRGGFCDDCMEGRFGKECKKCDCKNGTACDPHTGACPKVCEGDACKYNCTAGRYGEDCNRWCHCKGGGACHPKTGVCDINVGCQTRYSGSTCQITCLDGKFGTNTGCDRKCRCTKEEMCRVTDGVCEEGGCVGHFNGSDCQRCSRGFFGDECDKRCHCVNDTQCLRYTGRCVGGCSKGYTGATCQTVVPKKKTEEKKEDDDDDEVNIPLIAGCVVGGVIFLVLIAAIVSVSCCKDKKKEPKSSEGKYTEKRSTVHNIYTTKI